MEALGPKIRRQRRRMGFTLDDLAGRTGISKPYLSLIETKGSGFRVVGSGNSGASVAATLNPIDLDDAYLSGVLQELVDRSVGNIEQVAVAPAPVGAASGNGSRPAAVPVINRVSAGY